MNSPEVYVEGLYVKIKQCSEEEARSIFRPTPVGFNDSKKRLLGSGGVVTGEVDEDYPDASCVRTPASWRMRVHFWLSKRSGHMGMTF